MKMTKLFAKEIDNDNESLARRMRYVLDPDMSFYHEYYNMHPENQSCVLFIFNNALANTR